MTGPVRRLTEAAAQVGEAPLWLPDRKVWLWLDLFAREVHQYDPATGQDRVIAGGFAENLACVVRLPGDAVLVVSVTGFHRLSLADGAVATVACPVALPEGTIFNDGKADRSGALWVGSSDQAESAPIGALWRIAGGVAHEMGRGFIVSNGPAFSPGGDAAYFADTFTRRVLRFALDRAGNVTGQSVFATIPEAAGYPDGMTVDAEGTLYIGHWEGARISRWRPDGTALADIAIPAWNVTSLSFGGAGMRDAIVTSAALFPGQDPVGTAVWNGNLTGFRGGVAGLEELVCRG